MKPVTKSGRRLARTWKVCQEKIDGCGAGSKGTVTAVSSRSPSALDRLHGVLRRLEEPAHVRQRMGGGEAVVHGLPSAIAEVDSPLGHALEETEAQGDVLLLGAPIRPHLFREAKVQPNSRSTRGSLPHLAPSHQDPPPPPEQLLLTPSSAYTHLGTKSRGITSTSHGYSAHRIMTRKIGIIIRCSNFKMRVTGMPATAQAVREHSP